MLDARTQRKRREKLENLQRTVELGKCNVQKLEEEMCQLKSNESLRLAALPPKTWFTPSIPLPPSWSPEPATAEVNLITELANEMTEEDLKVLDGTVETEIADFWAISSCGIDTTSDCGRYKWRDPFIPTGKQHNILVRRWHPWHREGAQVSVIRCARRIKRNPHRTKPYKQVRRRRLSSRF